MFWDEVRKASLVGQGLRGGLCRHCKSGSVLLGIVPGEEGGMSLQCENCGWRVVECVSCDGTGVHGCDSECYECDSFGVRPNEAGRWR